MKAATIIGIILIVLGIFGFVYKSVTYTEKEKVVDVGPLEVEKKNDKTIPIPEILSGIAVVGGVVLVAVGTLRKK